MTFMGLVMHDDWLIVCPAVYIGKYQGPVIMECGTCIQCIGPAIYMGCCFRVHENPCHTVDAVLGA